MKTIYAANLLASSGYGPMVTFFQLMLGLICCCGLPFLLAWMVGFSAEMPGSQLSNVFRCRSVHPRYGRCALNPNHWTRGYPVHRGRRGGTWL